jgi:hypothetical protein
MGSFLHKYNTDNVHTRAVMVGLINLLNSKIQYENVLSDTSSDIVTVPFLPNMGGDERFLQDFFLHWNECIHPRMADGNYDVVPRGAVTLDSNSINTTAMTHRFVRGNYVKEVNGELQRFSAFLNSIPLTMDFSVEVVADNMLEVFKIQQAVLETFYKIQVFSVSFKGFRVPCQVGFPDELAFEKTFEFSYQSNETPKFNFNLSLETYYPVTDPTTERRDSNRMVNINGVRPGTPSEIAEALQFSLAGTTVNNVTSFTSSDSPQLGPYTESQIEALKRELDPDSVLNPDAGLNPESYNIGNKIYPVEEKNNPPAYLEITSPGINDSFFSTGNLPISWINTGIITSVNIYYKVKGSDDWVEIVRNVKNTGFYNWTVPFFDSQGQEVSSEKVGAKVISTYGKKGRIRAIVDGSGGVEKIVIFSQGFTYDNSDMIDVSYVVSSFETPPTTVDPVIQASVNNAGELIGAVILEPGSGFPVSPQTEVLLKVVDSTNSAAFDVLQKSAVFTGDISDETIEEDRFIISNCNPTVSYLLDNGYLQAGLSVDGYGIVENTLVESFDAVQNTIILSKQVVATALEESFSLSAVEAYLTIK